MGEQADALLDEQPAEAESAYLDLVRKVIEGRRFDAFLLSKIALGLLLAKIKRGDIDGARRTQAVDIEGNMLIGTGIRGLEQFQTSEHDRVLYYLVCAFLHSHETDPKAGAKAVTRCMRRVLKYARAKEPELVPMALRNWRLHLAHLYDGRAPASMAKALLTEERRYGREVPAVPMAFPPPAKWTLSWTDPGAKMSLVDRQGRVRSVTQAEFLDDTERVRRGGPSLLDRIKDLFITSE